MGEFRLAMFSFFLRGGSGLSIVRSLLFTFGLPGAWESSSSGVFTLDDPSQKTQAGYFGNDGDMCDAMDGQSCGELIKNNVRAESIHKGLYVGMNNYPSSGGKNPMF